MRRDIGRLRAGGGDLAIFLRSLLFPTGTEQGGLYDWTLPSVWQDSAGSTPGVIGQPAGLELDSRLGMARGANVVASFGLSNSSAAPAVPGSDGTLSYVDGVLTITRNTTEAVAWANNSNLTTGPYEYLFRVVSGTCVFRPSGATVYTGLSPGAYRYIDAIGTRMEFWPQNPGTTLVLDSLAANPLPGNHISQSTSTARGTLQQGYCDLSSGDDFYTSATGGGGTTGFFWCGVVQPTGGAGTTRRVWSDQSGNNGIILSLSAADGLSFAGGNGASFSGASNAGTVSVGTRALITAWDDGTNFNVQTGLGAVSSAARPSVVAGTAGFTVSRDNGAASSFLPGYLFPFTFRHSQPAPDAATRLAIQQRLAAAAGVTL